MKNANRDGCIYGQVYHERKEFEMNNNILGKLAGQAADALAKKNYDKTTDAYKAYIRGMLPPAHIDARARRYAVKLFLSHLHEVMYWYEFKKAPPYPYPMAHMGHAHQVPVPNFTPPTP
jgi:ribosomal protein L13